MEGDRHSWASQMGLGLGGVGTVPRMAWEGPVKGTAAVNFLQLGKLQEHPEVCFPPARGIHALHRCLGPQTKSMPGTAFIFSLLSPSPHTDREQGGLGRRPSCPTATLLCPSCLWIFISNAC